MVGKYPLVAIDTFPWCAILKVQRKNKSPVGDILKNPYKHQWRSPRKGCRHFVYKNMIAPEFLIIPYQLIADENIQPLDERVYGVIYWLTKLKGEKCIASNPTLAELARATSKSLQRSLLRLEKEQYIYRKYKDETRKIRQEIIPLIVFTRVSSVSDTRKNVPPVGYKVPPVGGTPIELKVPPVGDQKKSSNKNSKEERSSSKKPYYSGLEVRVAQGKMWVIPKDGGQWLEFAGEKKDIIYK